MVKKEGWYADVMYGWKAVMIDDGSADMRYGWKALMIDD